jgi:hypothetical protein
MKLNARFSLIFIAGALVPFAVAALLVTNVASKMIGQTNQSVGMLFADNAAIRITELFKAGESAARTYAALPFVKAMDWETTGPYQAVLIRSKSLRNSFALPDVVIGRLRGQSSVGRALVPEPTPNQGKAALHSEAAPTSSWRYGQHKGRRRGGNFDPVISSATEDPDPGRRAVVFAEPSAALRGSVTGEALSAV